MSITLNNVVAPDTYTKASTIENIPIQSILINTANQGIMCQLKTAIPPHQGSGTWEENAEFQLLPGSTPIGSDKLGEIVGFRFRAAVPASQIPAGGFQAVVSLRTSP